MEKLPRTSVSHSAMAEEIVAKVALVDEDSYRSYILGDDEKFTIWRHGSPPKYNLVNECFESGRTKAWDKGSLEEIVQNLVKSWEMELSHKTRLEDFKTIDMEKFALSVNGGPCLSAAEVLKVGSYNALLASLEQHGSNPLYKSSEQTFESSHKLFVDTFPNGFPWEVLAVYSGPPIVAFKWRHWGKVSGSGATVDMVGIVVAKVNNQLKIENLEVYYDPTQFLASIWGGACPDVCPFSA